MHDNDSILYNIDNKKLIESNNLIEALNNDNKFVEDNNRYKEDVLFLEKSDNNYNEFKIILNYSKEEGFMEDFLNESNLTNVFNEPNVMFNFGLDSEKWVKLLNKSILMHYERHILTTIENNKSTADKANSTNNYLDNNAVGNVSTVPNNTVNIIPNQINFFDPKANPLIRKTN